MNTTRPRVLAVVLGFIPSTMITVVKPLLGLHRAGRIRARIVLESQAAPSDIDWADVIVFCRNTEPRYAPLLAAIQSCGKPLIYDLDDNLFELPPDCGDGPRLREAPRQAMLAEYLRAAALVRVYSQALAQRVAALNPRVVQTFAPIDLSLLPPPRRTRPPGPIKIVYATGRRQDSLCDIFWPALARILSRSAGQVEVHFWGCRPPQTAALPGVRHHGLICQYDRYLRRFSRAGYDIGLAPLPDDLYYRSKTNNKFREYGASGIAGIYSQSEVYSHCVQHEVSGLLVANDAGQWHDAIQRMIDDESLRTRIQHQARQYVREQYAQEKFELLFLEQLHGVLGLPVESLLVPAARADALSCGEWTVDSGRSGRDWRLGAGDWGSCDMDDTAPLLSSTSPSTMHRPPSTVHRPPLSRLFHLARRSLDILRLGPRQAWEALRWFVSDRCLAFWLRWQLWQ